MTDFILNHSFSVYFAHTLLFVVISRFLFPFASHYIFLKLLRLLSSSVLHPLTSGHSLFCRFSLYSLLFFIHLLLVIYPPLFFLSILLDQLFLVSLHHHNRNEPMLSCSAPLFFIFLRTFSLCTFYSYYALALFDFLTPPSLFRLLATPVLHPMFRPVSKLSPPFMTLPIPSLVSLPLLLFFFFSFIGCLFSRHLFHRSFLS